MKNLLILLIFVPLFMGIEIPFTDWEWNFDFSWDFEQFIKFIKTGVPEFVTKMEKQLNDFISMAEDLKRKKIEEIKNIAEKEFNNLKNLEFKNKNFTKLIEYTTQAAQYLSYQICDAVDEKSYNECRNKKREVFKKLYGYVQEFKSEDIVNIITSNIIPNDINESLKYILFLINSLTKNPDAIEKGKADEIYELFYKVEDTINENLEKLINQLPETISIKDFKLDINLLLIQATENLVGIIHFEELDENIKKANKKTGLISDEKAKKIHQHLFNNLKKLNDFGTHFYNISSTLAVNVLVKPQTGEFNMDSEIVSEFKDKGIKLALNYKYLFNNYTNAQSIQTVIFDSPLVSIRGEREKKGGTANIFVGITLYDSKGNELAVTNINIENLRPIIYYKKNLFKAMTTCLYYNVKENIIENKGINTTEITLEDGIEYIKCVPQHLTSFTIGSYKSSKESIVGTVLLSIFICLLVIGIAVGGYCLWKKKGHKENNSQMNQAFPNKDGLYS